MKKMKYCLSALVVIAALSAAGSAQAGKCVDADGKDIYENADAIASEISAKKDSCRDAVALAGACARGASIDGLYAGRAYAVCTAELNQEQFDHEQLDAFFKARAEICDANYANQTGTMYRSMNNYCHLNNLAWVLNASDRLGE